jgi:hypothetical protein
MYNNKGSNVYCAFLDASKAFDRLVHKGLFLKLLERGFPKCFIDLIVSWYDGLFCRVKWGGTFSDWFPILAGVRQGGILSPTFYSIYVDDLVVKLKRSNVGCYLDNLFLSILLYADDMAIIAPSLKVESLFLAFQKLTRMIFSLKPTFYERIPLNMLGSN